MPRFSGTPVTIGRFGGFADYTDPTNLPLGLSPLCKNSDFSLNSVRTRDGYVTAMTGPNAQPITGMINATYTPETSNEAYTRLFTFMDGAGVLSVEQPSGSGTVVPITAWASAVLASVPAGSHMFGVPAYNRGYCSFAQLVNLSGTRYGFTAGAGPYVIDLKTKRLDPLGLRPFGENWKASEPYLVGEMVTPTLVGGNRHTYRCMVSGFSSANEPGWPTADSAVFADGGVTWKEYTATLANRLPIPNAPSLTLAASGTFAAAMDVWVILTSTNPQGETTASAPTKITTSADAQEVVVGAIVLPAWIGEVPAPYDLTGFNVYAAAVATANPEPAQSSYQLSGTTPAATAYALTAVGSGGAPPARNSARLTPGMLLIPDDAVAVQREAATGTFAAALDVYVRQTYMNVSGETPLGPSSSVINTVLNDAVQFMTVGKLGYDISEVGIYEADVATGSAEPDKAAFTLVGYYPIGTTGTITNTATGTPAPTVNETGSSGNILVDSPTGGINATQGYHYAAIMFEDFQETRSGFRANSVIKTAVDEDGWGLGIYHVATGPANVKQRDIALTAANGTTVGPFFKIDPRAVSDGVTMTATLIPDNATTLLQMDYTDAYLIAQEDLTYRLQTIKPYPCIDLYYAPSVDRFFQSGVPGFSGSHWISRAADAGSYQGDVGYVSGGATGERAFCVREFRETLYSLRERSGFTITPDTANPAAWDSVRRWSKVGPCGPRAVDVGKRSMIFVHRSGIYLYDGSSDPELVSDEMPAVFGKFWNTINWSYAETIWVAIDEDKQVVRIGVPTGSSTSPDKEIALWYVSGWGRGTANAALSVDAVSSGRAYSINDCSANLGMRVERDMAAPLDEAAVIDPSYLASQFLYASGSPDGTIQAIQPGRRDDNGSGIDWVYETASSEASLAVMRVSGYNLNAVGNGLIYPSLIPSRSTLPVPLREFALVTDQNTAVSRYAPTALSEQWRMRFTNKKQAGTWCELKGLEFYILPRFSAR